MTKGSLLQSRIYAALTWLLLALAILHMATTFRLTTGSTQSKVWFFSAGLAMAQTAALNLLHRKYGQSAPGLCWVTRASNALLLVVSYVGGVATGASIGELTAVLGLLAAILVLSFVNSALQAHQPSTAHSRPDA